MLTHPNALPATHQDQIGVKVVAQNRIASTGVLDQRFGVAVIFGEGDRAFLYRVRQRGIDDMCDPFLRCGCDGVFMRCQSLAWFQIVDRDDQQTLAAGKSRAQRCGVVEIALAGLDALVGQIGQLFRRAGNGADRTGTGRNQVVDDLSAKLAGCTGDDERAVLNVCHWIS